MIAFRGDHRMSDSGRRAEFRGVPAPSVETENNHEHRGARSVETSASESAGGRTR